MHPNPPPHFYGMNNPNSYVPVTSSPSPSQRPLPSSLHGARVRPSQTTRLARIQPQPTTFPASSYMPGTPPVSRPPMTVSSGLPPQISMTSTAIKPIKKSQPIQSAVKSTFLSNESVTPEVIQMMLHENKLLIKAILEQQAAGRPQEAIL